MSLSTASKLLGRCWRLLCDVHAPCAHRSPPSRRSVSRLTDVGGALGHHAQDSQRSASQCSYTSRDDDSLSVRSRQHPPQGASRLSYQQHPPLFASKDHQVGGDPSKIASLHLQCADHTETIGRMEARLSLLGDAVKDLTQAVKDSREHSQRRVPRHSAWAKRVAVHG